MTRAQIMDAIEVDDAHTALVLGAMADAPKIGARFSFAGYLHSVTALDDRGPRQRSCLTGQAFSDAPHWGGLVAPAIAPDQLSALRGQRIKMMGP